MLVNDRIIVVTRESGTAHCVSEALTKDGHVAAPSVCGDLAELRTSLERSGARAVLVDIDPAPDAMLADLARITARFGETRFLIIASEHGSDRLLGAMQAGARHFLRKTQIAGDLASIVAQVCPVDAGLNGHAGQAQSGGSVITVLAAGGGCGATTLAINLANELCHLASEPTLLVDLDAQCGSIGGTLGLHGDYGIADVLEGGDRLDAHLIRSSAVEYATNLDVLLSPATVQPLDPAAMNMARIESALRQAREAYRYVIVDAPRPTLAAAHDLVNASDQTYVLFEMNVEDIRIVRTLLAALEHRGIARDALTLLAMRHRPRRDAISIDEACRAIGVTRIDHIANDYSNAVVSVNYGKPLAETAPRSEIRREIQKLATGVYERTLAGLRSHVNEG